MPPRKRAPAYEGRHRSGTPDPPAREGTKPASPTRRRGPQHDSGEIKLTGAAKTARDKSQREKRSSQLVEEGRAYAYRQAARSSTGRPSVAGRATAGAVAGAAAGSALGAPGAAAGAVVGGAGGALAGRAAKKAYRMAQHASPGARRVIVAEFLACMAIAAFTPLTDEKQGELPAAFMKRMTAIMALFFILGMVSAAGRGPSRFAAGFGGLVTLALALSSKSVFVKVGTIFAGDRPPAEDPESGAPGEDIGTEVGRVAGKIADFGGQP